MSDYADLPNGPSGRIPKAGIRIADTNVKSSQTILVLFQDGAFGIYEEDDSVLIYNRKSFDKSEYNMILYSMEDLGKIEKKEFSKKRATYALLASLAIGCFYLALYLYVRSNSSFPYWFIDFPFSFQFAISVPVIGYFFVHSIFRIIDAELIIFPINSDPYKFPIQSHAVATLDSVIGVMFVLCLGCLIAISNPNLYFDIFLIILISASVFSYFKGKPFKEMIFSRKIDSDTPILDITEFLVQTKYLKEEISHQLRTENPLLEILMGNESQVIEFKSSLWTAYMPTGEIVKKQNGKMLELEDEVVKTVAAFLNTDGGTLLIGVKDKPRSAGDEIAEIRGIEPDFKWLKKKDIEGYTHQLLQIFENAYSNPVNSPIVSQNIKITYREFDDKIVCRIDVKALPRKVGQQCFTDTKCQTEFGSKELFFMRSSDTTTNMSSSSQYGYIRHHFEGYSGENNQN